MAEDEWITIARYVETIQAELARTRLESAGISSFLVGENTALLYGNGLGGLQLQVMPQDEADARGILAEPQDALLQGGEDGAPDNLS